MFSRETVILQCTASRVAVGVFSWRRGRLRLSRHAFRALSATGGEWDAWLEQVEVALRELRQESGRVDPCVLVFPGHLVLTKFLKLPRLAPAQREKIIRFESEQSLPIALSDLVWDTAVSGEHESSVEVMLAAVHRVKAEALCAAVRAAGFELSGALPAMLALLAAFRLAHGRPSQPSVLINVEARSTTMLRVEGGRFIARTFASAPPATGNGENQAAGTATRLAQEFTRSMLFFRQQGHATGLGQVYLAGCGSRIAGLDQALAAKLKLPVQHFALPGALAVASEASCEAEGGTGNTLVELAGAAAGWLCGGQVLLNLMPSGRPVRSGRRRQTALLLGAMLLAALPIHYFRAKPAEPYHPTAITHPAPQSTAIVPAGTGETLPAEAPVSPAQETPFDVELVEVGTQTEPYRLQLVGYVGGPGDYLAAFVSPRQPETLLARSGNRFQQLGLALRSFEVKKVVVAPNDIWPVYDVAGFAVLCDEKTGEEVVLDSRMRKLTDAPQATLRFLAAEGQSRVLHEGDTFTADTTTYRIERIQVDPPEVVVAKQMPGQSLAETRILRFGASTGGDAGHR